MRRAPGAKFARQAERVAVELIEGKDLVRVGLEVVDEPLADVGVAARHAGELAQGNRRAVGDAAHLLVERVVEAELTLVGELQDQRHGTS